MYFHRKPDRFDPKFEIVACWLMRPDGRFVLLHRQPWKPEGNTWGVPAGKIEEGEVPIVAMRRELSEEVGLVVPSEDSIGFERILYVRYPTYEFVYHMYRMDAPDGFEVTINPKEHRDFKWVAPEESLDMPLIRELDSCVRISFLGGE